MASSELSPNTPWFEEALYRRLKARLTSSSTCFFAIQALVLSSPIFTCLVIKKTHGTNERGRNQVGKSMSVESLGQETEQRIEGFLFLSSSCKHEICHGEPWKVYKRTFLEKSKLLVVLADASEAWLLRTTSSRQETKSLRTSKWLNIKSILRWSVLEQFPKRKKEALVSDHYLLNCSVPCLAQSIVGSQPTWE